MFPRLLYSCAIALFGTVLQATETPPSDMLGIRSEVIVKFSAGSESQLIIDRILSTSSSTEQSLVPLIQDLSAQTGFPLRLLNITSGAELLLAIDTEKLLNQIRSRMESRPEVKRIRLRSVPNERRMSSNPLLIVELDPQHEPGRSLVGNTGKTQYLLDRWVADLPRRAGLALHPSLAVQLELAIDVPTLMEHLIDRLRQRPDIGYVQPNRMFEPYPPRLPDSK